MRRPPGRSLLRRGSRTVLLTYPALRLGNYLYFLLHAHLEERAGRELRVLDSGLGREWTALFPALGPLLVRPEELRFRDRRVPIPPTFLQAFGEDFTREQLDDFIRHRLLDAPGLCGAGSEDPGAVTVNVRRGDYYTEAGFRSAFGFDIPSYLEDALGAVAAEAPISGVDVVSDDPAWCVEALGRLGPMQGRPVRARPAGDPVADFLAVARSRRIVLTNSTFSYWAAYVAAVLAGEELRVWAPDFHSREVDGGRPWQHDPRWSAVGLRGEGTR